MTTALPLGEIRRSRTLLELEQQFAASTTDACRAHVSELRVRSDDVFISTFAKCGTTWMQQMVHGLRSRGDMSFGEISEVVPFLEVAFDCGIDLNAPQRHSPRAFKTHKTADELLTGGRYIIVLRDPADACVSFYNFMSGWYLEPGAVSLQTFTENLFLAQAKGDGYWEHLCSWWPHRDADTVRIFCFEDIKADPAACVRSVAEFIGTALDDDLEQVVLEQSSFEFMLRNKHKFDDNLLRRARDAAIGLPADGESSKVKSGSVGSSKSTLPDHVLTAFDAVWRAQVTPVTGAETYRELRAMLKR